MATYRRSLSRGKGVSFVNTMAKRHAIEQKDIHLRGKERRKQEEKKGSSDTARVYLVDG